MQTEIPHGKGKGHWQRTLVDELGDNPHWGALVWCPECGRVLFAKDHAISAGGQITPSLGHPDDYPACPWHTHPRLVGWSPVPPTPAPREFSTCESCGVKSRSIGGWGTWSGGRGIICPTCFAGRLPTKGGENV
jgi:hypothetical protein